jgi:GABA(A) receptor-associated protein
VRYNYIFKKKIEFAPGEFERIQQKYPNTVCVFLQKAPRAELPPIEKGKFIVPKELTVGQFLFTIRKRIQIPPEKALFLFVNNVLPTTSTTISELYAKYKSTDGALRIIVTSESTFGA